MTDLDVIHKAIIESKGCKEDSFPYEYYCPDDFSVVINPEDWTIDDYESYAETLIPASLQVPENYELKLGSCNNRDYFFINEDLFYIKIGPGKDAYEGFVKINLEENKISVTVYSEVDLSIVGAITLNFKDLIFLGNKK